MEKKLNVNQNATIQEWRNMMSLLKQLVFLIAIFITLSACNQTEKDDTIEEPQENNQTNPYPSTNPDSNNSLAGTDNLIVPLNEVTPCVKDGLYTFSDNQVQYFTGTISYEGGGTSINILDGKSMDNIIAAENQGNSSVDLIGFSPNGEWLAYKSGSYHDDNTPRLLHIVSHDRGVDLGNISTRIEYEHDISEFRWGDALWINDEVMLVYRLVEEVPRYFYFEKELFDPFTGEWLKPSMSELNRKPHDAVSISPDLTRVFYLGYMDDLHAIILEDLDKGTVLWHSREGTSNTAFTNSVKVWLGGAAWSPNSEWLAFVGDDENDEQNVYLLNRSGEIQVITDFYSQYQQSFKTWVSPFVSISGLQWSPDGRYLAIGVSILDSAPELPLGPAPQYYRLFLYDLENNRLIDHCWLSFALGIRAKNRALTWSPDSQYIAHTNDLQTLSDGSKLPESLFIINIYTGEVNRLVEGPVGLGGWSEYSFLNNFSRQQE